MRVRFGAARWGCCVLGIVAAFANVHSAFAASITYTMDQSITGYIPVLSLFPNLGPDAGTGTITGTITTDGKLGILSAADVVNWNLELTTQTPSGATTYDLAYTSPGVEVSGQSLTATATALMFDFSGPAGDLFLLQTSLNNNGLNYYCVATSTGTCFAGITDAPQSVWDGTGVVDQTVSGNQIIAIASSNEINPTPLPATWTLMLGALGAIASLLYRRKKVPVRLDRPGSSLCKKYTADIFA
jgi:hypothetical protein